MCLDHLVKFFFCSQIYNYIFLTVKSEYLTIHRVIKSVMAQMEDANKVKAKLDEITVQRFRLKTLRTPNATFTSVDAYRALSYWNISTSRSFLERVLLKNPVTKQIQDLETLELALKEKVEEYEEAQSDYVDKEISLQKARGDRVLAVQAEKRAREALALAQLTVDEATSRVKKTTKALSKAGSTIDKVAYESERLMSSLERQREIVRSSLQKKEEIIAKESANITGSLLEDANDLEEKELELNEEYKRLEELANRLQSRANKLKKRAEELKRMT